MKKAIIGVIVIIIIIFGLLFFQKPLKEKFLSTNSNESSQENNNENTEPNAIKCEYILERKEISTSKLYSIDGHSSYYEVDLMQNDMTWNNECALYHKLITNKEDYDKYNERIELPEIDFSKNFIVVISNENLKQADETDLLIYEVVADDTTTHIKMRQRENPVVYTDEGSLRSSSDDRIYYSDNNVFWAVVDNSQLRDKADVTIEH